MNNKKLSDIKKAVDITGVPARLSDKKIIFPKKWTFMRRMKFLMIWQYWGKYHEE